MNSVNTINWIVAEEHRFDDYIKRINKPGTAQVGAISKAQK